MSARRSRQVLAHASARGRPPISALGVCSGFLFRRCLCRRGPRVAARTPLGRCLGWAGVAAAPPDNSGFRAAFRVAASCHDSSSSRQPSGASPFLSLVPASPVAPASRMVLSVLPLLPLLLRPLSTAARAWLGRPPERRSRAARVPTARHPSRWAPRCSQVGLGQRSGALRSRAARAPLCPGPLDFLVAGARRRLVAREASTLDARRHWRPRLRPWLAARVRARASAPSGRRHRAARAGRPSPCRGAAAQHTQAVVRYVLKGSVASAGLRALACYVGAGGACVPAALDRFTPRCLPRLRDCGSVAALRCTDGLRVVSLVWRPADQLVVHRIVRAWCRMGAELPSCSLQSRHGACSLVDSLGGTIQAWDRTRRGASPLVACLARHFERRPAQVAPLLNRWREQANANRCEASHTARASPQRRAFGRRTSVPRR